MRVVVVGGGIAGLAAAHELRARGAEVVVLEAGTHPGGKLRSAQVDGFLCEHAANAMLPAADGAADLARELGVELVAANPAAKRRWIWRKGALQPAPMSPPSLIGSRLLSWKGKLRLLAEPLQPRGRNDDETIAAFGRRRLGREATEALLDPLLTGIYAGDIDRLSFPACLPKLAAMERRHRSLIIGAVRERGDRVVGGLMAPKDGMGAIPDALARSLGEAYRSGATVSALRREGATWRVVSSRGEDVADRVVVALPPRALAPLVEAHDAGLADLLRGIEVAAAMVVHVALPAREVRARLDGFGFLVARNEALRCLGCVCESNVWPGRAPEGQALLRLIYGGVRDPEILRASDDTVAQTVRDDLAYALGSRVEPRVVSLVRWADAIPQYTVGHVSRVTEMDTRARRLGLVLAGAGFHGVAVNDCVGDRRRVGADVLGA